MKARARGMTLLELLAVVTVITILALIIIPRVRGAQTRTREANLREDLRGLRMAITQFQLDVGGFPLTLEQLTLPRAEGRATLPAVDAAGNALDPAGYHGPYLVPRRLPRDPFSVDGTWEYDPHTGHVHCNTNRLALDGTSYSGW